MRDLLNLENRRDLWLALLVFLVGVGLYVGALDVPPPLFDPLGSAAVPKAIAVALMVLAVLLVLQGRARFKGIPTDTPDEDRTPDETSDEVPDSGLDAMAAIAAVLVPAVYVLSVQYGLFDFAIGSTIFVFLYGFVFMSEIRKNVVLWLIPVAILFGVGLTLIYTQVFTIDLPLDALISLGLSL